MPYKVKNRSKWHWKLLLPLLVLVIALGIGALFVKSHENKLTTTGKSTATTATGGSIDYSPATPADNAANESRKGNSTSSPTLNSSPTPSTGLTVSMSATPTGNKTAHVGSLISGATSGTCTLTGKQTGQADVVLTSAVRQDVNNYDCGPLNPQFPTTGTWNLTLTVTNASASGSASQSVIIN